MNLCINHFSQAEIIPCAAADTERMTDFYAPAANDLDSGNGPCRRGWTGKAWRHHSRGDSTDGCDCLRCRVERRDLSKIDVEGFEWLVLRGGESTIAKLRQHIVFEYNA